MLMEKICGKACVCKEEAKSGAHSIFCFNYFNPEHIRAIALVSRLITPNCHMDVWTDEEGFKPIYIRLFFPRTVPRGSRKLLIDYDVVFEACHSLLHMPILHLMEVLEHAKAGGFDPLYDYFQMRAESPLANRILG